MKKYDLDMLEDEVKPITVEVEDLQTGETLTAATVTHSPPSGTALVISPTIDGFFINMLFGPFTPAGFHFVDVLAEGSNGSEPEVRYQIKVRS